MDHYTPHCFHRGLESFSVKAADVGSPVEMIDVRSAKIFTCWVKTTFPAIISFGYYWEDKRTLLETSESVEAVPGEFVRVQFGTYKGFALPGMFLDLRVGNLSGDDGEVTFAAIAQLQ